MKAKVIETGEIVDVYHEPQHGLITNVYKESVLFLTTICESTITTIQISN